MLMLQKCEMTDCDIDLSTILTVEQEKPFNASVDISCDELKTQYAVS